MTGLIITAFLKTGLIITAFPKTGLIITAFRIQFFIY
jgi:hypothetical protein